MGQAWCKEKSSKAQDSKSPLDRVFVRCAHRIYPSLKEEGSVLGGATQRVTSSEIGYAGSPPRSTLLQRGLSIDSVDRPFHPSEWVDVNLEVPCSPRDSVVLTRLSAITPELLQQRASSPSNSLSPRRPKEEETGTGTPVPPPRRRRRSRRPLPPEPGPTAHNNSSSNPEDESDEFGHYSQLATPRRDNDVASKNSDEEFIAIEESLKNRSSAENVSHPDPEQLYEKVSKKKNRDPALATRPKNHSTTSLPNYAELDLQVTNPEVLSTSTTTEEKTVVVRPPRHVKAASLPRDATPFTSNKEPPQSPESRSTVSLSRSTRIEDDAWPADLVPGPADNSIFKVEEQRKEEEEEDVDESFEPKESDVKTSTPVKAAPAPSAPEEEELSGNLDNVFDGSKNESLVDSSSRSLHEAEPEAAEASVSGNPGVIEEVVEQAMAPVVGVEEQPRIEDPGYETAGSVSFTTSESRNLSELFILAERELSSGIIEDASCVNEISMRRTISEESLPRDMLVEDSQIDEEKSAKDASNELVRQISASDSDNFKTPSPSPDMKSRTDEEEPSGTANNDKSADEGNPTSTTTTTTTTTTTMNLTGMLEAALDDIRPREESPEPQIVPSAEHRNLQSPPTSALFENDYDLDNEFPKIDPVEPPKRINPFNEYNLQSNGSSDLHLLHHRQEFNNSADNIEDAPEKPIRLYRISLVEEQESVLQEPLIVPTPPRRRHRSKSNLNTSANEVIEALHSCTYATTNDRLI